MLYADGKDVLLAVSWSILNKQESIQGILPVAYHLIVSRLMLQDKLRAQMRQMALELGVIGLMNAQFAIQDNEVFTYLK